MDWDKIWYRGGPWGWGGSWGFQPHTPNPLGTGCISGVQDASGASNVHFSKNLIILLNWISGTLSISGTIYGVLASLFVSLYAIYIKRVLPEVNHSVWLLTLYNNINAIILFCPLMIVFGEPAVILNYSDIFSLSFWGPMTVAGIFGFAIGYVTGLQVKVSRLNVVLILLIWNL